MNNGTPTSKSLLITLLVVVLIVIGFVFYSHHGTKGLPDQVSETTPLPAPSEWPSAKISEETISDKKSYYTITAVYPVTKDSVINDYFKSFVDDSIASFKDDTSWAAGDGADVAPAEAGDLSLDIKYTEQKSARADNYVFSITTYTGGAHGLSATKTFTFSPTGQVINLSSLFTSETKGLAAVSAYVRQQLLKMPNAVPDMINEGTVPTEANFLNFVVTDDGITFTFDPYSVAPYSEGTKIVDVPVSAFKAYASADIFAK